MGVYGWLYTLHLKSCKFTLDRLRGWIRTSRFPFVIIIDYNG